VTFEGDDAINVSALRLSDTTFLLAYRDFGGANDGTAVVGTVSGDTITFGTPVAFDTSPATNISMARLTDTTAVIGYRDFLNDDAQAIVATVSGNSVSFGTAITVNTDSAVGAMIAPISSTTVFVAYRDNANTGDGKGAIGTISGTNITLGTTATFDSSNVAPRAAVGLDSDTVVLLYSDTDDSIIGHLVAADVSGAIPSFGTPVEITTGNLGHPSMASLDDSTVIVAYRDHGIGNNGGTRVATIAGTTVTAGDKDIFDADTIQYTSVSSFNSTTPILSYEDDNGYVLVGTVSGTDTSFSISENVGNIDTAQTAVIRLTSSTAVVAYNTSLEIGRARLLTYAEQTNNGGAYAHKRIRERYAEIAAGLHSSAEDMTDTDAPSLEDVGIFKSTMKTISPLPPVLVTTGALETEEPARISRLHNRIALMKSAPELVVAREELAQQEPEKSPFQQRVCTRVQKRFIGNALIRVEARLQKTFGWSC
jgi:hypothetical protein